MALRPTRPQNRSEQLAERDAAQQDAFLREVDDALREDEFFTVLRRYGKPALGVVAAGLVLLAGGLWYNSWREDQQAAHGEQVTIALDQMDAGSLAMANTTLAPIATGKDGSAAVARLLQADIAVKQGHKDEAARQYGTLAADAAMPQPFRQLASIRAVALTFDTLPPAEVIARLKPLAVPGNPWFASAGELVGMAYLAQGNKPLAGAMFAAIARDKASPETLRARTRQMAGALGLDTIDDITPAPAPAAPAPGQ